MRGWMAGALALSLGFGLAATVAAQGLQDENVLAPMPKGFKIGYQGQQGQVSITEMVPAAETVDVWSRMVTQQTFRGIGGRDPDGLPDSMSKPWATACPGGSSQRLSGEPVNGYRATLWVFRCPLNPATQKPEVAWLRAVSGADAVYGVQYAARAVFSDDLAREATAYLSGVIVCDTRAPAHPCPNLRAAGH